MGTHAATRERSPVSISDRFGAFAAVIGVAGLIFLIALVAAGRPANAVEILAVFVLVAVAVAFPRALLALALVATMFPQRVGPPALDMSVTDAVSVLAVIASLRFVPWQDRRLRMVLSALAFYLGMLAVSLVVHHDQRAVFEWAHRGVLFAGSIFVGIAIVHSGMTRWALRLFMLAMAALAVAASLEALRTGLEPAYVFQLQKNHTGLLLAAAFLVAYAAGNQLAWSFRTLFLLRVLTVVGLAATQSRAAALGLVAVLAIRPLLLGRRGNRRTASIGLLVVCVGLLALSAISINQRELSRPTNQLKFNSINTRTDVLAQAIDEVWLKNRFVGGGLRYFRDPDRPYPSPHNVIIGEMAEAGLIGLVGLGALLTTTAMALRRSRAQLAALGMMAFILRLTQGMADIFWVAGPLTVALILVGMGLTADPGTEGDADGRDRARVRGYSPPRLDPSHGPT